MAEFPDTVARHAAGTHPTFGSLPDAALGPLRRSVVRLALGLPPDSELRDSIRIACGDAHSRGVRAEHLLVALKGALDEAITDAGVARGPVRNEITRRVVTLCIDEYYSRPRPAA